MYYKLVGDGTIPRKFATIDGTTFTAAVGLNSVVCHDILTSTFLIEYFVDGLPSHVIEFGAAFLESVEVDRWPAGLWRVGGLGKPSQPPCLHSLHQLLLCCALPTLMMMPRPRLSYLRYGTPPRLAVPHATCHMSAG